VIDLRAIAAVALGAAIGGVLRYVVGQLFLQRFGPGFPYGTLFINVSGSFLIGVVAELIATRAFGVSPLWRIFAATGVLGGYTTFSAFSLESLTLITEGSAMLSLAYAAGSVVLGVLAAYGGVAFTRLTAGQ
jgi:CrcB protein